MRKTNTEVEKTPTLKDYLAGAVLANSLAWLVLGLMPFFATDPWLLMLMLFITYMLGTIIAGYSVARKAFENHMKIGLKTGLGSFILHIYVFMGVIDWVSGRRLLHLLDHLLILVVFVFGGFLGAFLYTRLSSRNMRTA
jgi:uncharacterized protein YneF (UPF0154 family)